MANQSGHVFRKGNAWFLRYRDSLVENGQLVRKQICKKLSVVDPEHVRLRKPPQSVLDLAEEELNPINSISLEPSKNVTVQDFVTRVYFPNMEGQKRASTLKGYKARWDSQLKARCGQFRLREFKTPQGHKVLADIGRANPKFTRSTLHHLRSLLSAIFRHAIQQGYLTGANPIREASIPSAPEGKETYAYSLPEVMQMLRLLPDPARAIVAVAAFLGLRRGEIRGLEWQDYTGEEIRVMRSLGVSHKRTEDAQEQGSGSRYRPDAKAVGSIPKEPRQSRKRADLCYYEKDAYAVEFEQRTQSANLARPQCLRLRQA